MSTSSPARQDGFLERTFGLRENNTSTRTEVIAGLTTFMTMAYIIFVNPLILGDAGMDKQAVFLATCLSAALATLVMGFYANYPFALAPGMGLNAFFSYSVVLGMGYTWQTALGAVFISGILFILLTLTGVRERILNTVPLVLRQATGAGIGLFIALIGFKNAGLVVSNEATLVSLGNVKDPGVLLAIFGLVFTLLLMVRKVRGSLLIGIVATTLISLFTGFTQWPGKLIGWAAIETPAAFQLDIAGALAGGILTVIVTFFFVDLFDTLGTLVGVASKAKMMKDGELPRAGKALMADAIGTVAGALLGTSTVTTYVESASGVSEGGRTGLTAVVVGILFLFALFFAPVIGMVPSQATAPALIIVGILMVGASKGINWDDLTEAIPAFLTMVAMPFSFSIATGIGFGFISYSLFKYGAGRAKEVHPITLSLGIIFLIRFIWLGSV